jgi:hypothetical protein
MNKTILTIAILALLAGCKAWDASKLVPVNQPISPRLVTLERRIGDFINTNMAASNDEITLFSKEVENNLMDPYGDKFGSIALKRNIIYSKIGMGLYLLSSMLFTIPNIFGMPFMNIRYKVEVEIRISDKDNKLIGKYSAIGTSSVIVAYYYGYSLRNAYRKAYPDALMDAFNKIRPQIQADVESVNEKLKASDK